ncbi:MAG: GTP 3',8-cyclase MoaA [Thermoplasmata archaeon]|nr:GTP 3',8-cyclase MoaA [Thermoplasmata archaeon]
MRDRYGREATDLRISLTQRCNLRCVFCHMEGQPAATAELTPTEIETVVRVASRLGVDRVKLTGGEPTLRTDLVEIVSRISPHLSEVSMTTNGLRLETLARPLKEAGLARVNVSLPSLEPSVYRELTGVDGVGAAIRGIRAAAEAGLAPIKLNVVALDGTTNTTESVDRLLSFAQDVGAWVQVIEFENVRGRVDPSVYRDLHSELGKLSASAAARAFATSTNRLHGRPRYTFYEHARPVTVEVVQPVENPEFCMACSRLRLTSDGKLKGCLMTNNGLVDLKPLFSAEDPDAAIGDAFERAVRYRRPFFVGPTTPAPDAPAPDEGGMGEPLPLFAHP